MKNILSQDDIDVLFGGDDDVDVLFGEDDEIDLSLGEDDDILLSNELLFNNAQGDEIGRLEFKGSELKFIGSADESSKLLFEFVSNSFSQYIEKEINAGIVKVLDSNIKESIDKYHKGLK